jgi:arginine-tRNA-protein transferase
MDAGFRRAGDAFYQMVCPRCRACTPLRVPVRGFRPTKGQRRVLRKSADLSLAFGRPALTDEKLALYRRYLQGRHDGRMSTDPGDLEEFLYRSPTRTLEVTYRNPAGTLLAVGICDQTPLALSSVYFYFEPEEARRGLGTFGSLIEIELARSLGLPYYYLGLWVEGCPKMEYKARLRPCEVLGTDGLWRALREASPA